MLNFAQEQKVITIGKIKIGGNSGENPTVLIGSIFHKGDKIVSNERMGIFDKNEAERLIFKQKELSDLSGNPCLLDVAGIHEKAIRKYIDFVANITEDPFLLNAPSAKIRMKLIRYAREIGLNERIVYTSINFRFMEEEINTIKQCKIKSALLQAFNPRDPRISGMIKLLRVGLKKEGLIEKAKQAGLKNLLIFTNVLDLPSIGVAARGIYQIKETFGLPTGTAPVGIIGKWCINTKEFEGNFKSACETTGIALARAMGADYIIYGALKKAEYVFPATKIIDDMILYNSRITFKLRNT
jgi:tetrahydromethanopterin S-methyltransferase subunit H